MTISDAQYAAWLDDSTAQRVTLYRIGCLISGVPSTLRLSNRAYIGSSATPYLAAIAKDLEITQSISMDGDAKLSAGDVDVHNPSGEFDAWYAYVFANQDVEALIGDVRWPESDFRTQFVGYLADIAPAPRHLITFKFRDILQGLNTPVSEVKLTGDVLCPVALGEVPNMTPKFDSVTGKWHYHVGAAEGLIEPRTDGKKRSTDVTDDPTNGRLGFNAAVGPGMLTCSVQGDKTGGIYRNTIATLVQLLATSYGKASTRMTSGDMDTANLAAFDAANPQPVGLGLFDRTNVLAAMAQLAASKGAQVIPSMLGKLRIIQYAIPTSATLDIPRSMIMRTKDGQSTLTLVSRSPVAAAVSIGFCRNYTPEANLQTSIPPEHKQMFAQEWQTYTTPVDGPTQTAYSLYSDPVMEPTCLLKLTDATAEGLRRQTLKKVPHPTYRMELSPAGLLVQLGEARNLFGDRYNLAAGVPGLVTSLTVNLGTYRTIAEVTI